MKSTLLASEIWPEGPPRNAWHSFDATPWLHPWLTQANLRALREASKQWREEARNIAARAADVPRRFAFVGNMANNLYLRAKPLAQAGAMIEVFGLYADDSPMSDARWEEYDDVLPDGASYLRDDNSFLAGIETAVPFSRFNASGRWMTMRDQDLPARLRADFRRWPGYFCNLPAIERLQTFDAVLATQHPFIGYLSGKPYIATQTGGDIWFEAARDDALGRLQRTAFAQAACVLVSNPWTCAHARRYGLTNLIFLPLILDEQDYSPGPPAFRDKWRAESGGDFFVLSTARADDHYKGSQIGLRGFAEFARKSPGARLVVATWGKNIEQLKSAAGQLGIADRLLFERVAGKRRVVKYLRSADCLLDQLVIGYYGATALEGAACGVPVIMRCNHAQYDALCENGAPPFLDAASVSEVTNALDLVSGADAERRQGLADTHRRWFLANHSGQRWAEDYRTLLDAVALGHRFSFAKSPLNAPLSAVEQLYHAEQLAAAPEFPNYEISRDELEIRDQIRELKGELIARLDEIQPQIGKIFMRLKEIEEYYNKMRQAFASAAQAISKLGRWINGRAA